MSPSERVRKAFPAGRFGAPCLEADIAAAERELQIALPEVLKELYCAFNGFRGCGNSELLFSLIHKDSHVESTDTLVGFTKFVREGEEFDQELTRKCTFYGGPATGALWGFHRDLPGKVILWDAEWENPSYEIAGDDIVDVWLNHLSAYEPLRL